ncbi:MAG TPA: ATP-binding cassette domain-containing protein [Thermoanaerobaculia bacterium]
MNNVPRDLINVRNLSVRVRATGRMLLRDVSLDVPQNRITGIIGPSGAGKSTLLKCINRLIDLVPSVHVTGEVLLDGVDVRAKSCDADDLRRRIGIVFQQPVTFHGSIARNVSFAARRLGLVDKKNEAQVVEESLRAANLWDEVKDRLHHAAHTLSVGQQQRLAIARTLAGSPDVLLMDEPTSALDAASTAIVERTILGLRKSKTILVVTHHLQQARRLADFVACLCSQDGSGTLVESGVCETVLLTPRHAETRRLVGIVG